MAGSERPAKGPESAGGVGAVPSAAGAAPLAVRAPASGKSAAFAAVTAVPAGATSISSLASTWAGARHWASLQGWKSRVARRVLGPGTASAAAVPSTTMTVSPSKRARGFSEKGSFCSLWAG